MVSLATSGMLVTETAIFSEGLAEAEITFKINRCIPEDPACCD